MDNVPVVFVASRVCHRQYPENDGQSLVFRAVIFRLEYLKLGVRVRVRVIGLPR